MSSKGQAEILYEIYRHTWPLKRHFFQLVLLGFINYNLISSFRYWDLIVNKSRVNKSWALSPEYTSKFSLTISLDNFPLRRSLREKLVMPAFEPGDLSKKICQFFRTHEQIKLVKEKHVKENLVRCKGL